MTNEWTITETKINTSCWLLRLKAAAEFPGKVRDDWPKRVGEFHFFVPVHSFFPLQESKWGIDELAVCRLNGRGHVSKILDCSEWQINRRVYMALEHEQYNQCGEGHLISITIQKRGKWSPVETEGGHATKQNFFLLCIYHHNTVPALAKAGLTNGLSAHEQTLLDRQLLGSASIWTFLVSAPLGGRSPVLPVHVTFWRDSNGRTDGHCLLLGVSFSTTDTGYVLMRNWNKRIKTIQPSWTQWW